MESQDESSEWVEVRRRRRQKRNQLPTILDYLNADCWRLVLDQLSFHEVVRSERVSRGWQQMVLEYFQLSGGQHISIDLGMYIADEEPVNFFRNKDYRCIYISGHEHEVFNSFIKKMGPFIKSLITQLNSKRFEVVTIHCPKLENLKLYKPPRCLPLGLLRNLRSLFIYHSRVNDDDLNKVLAIESLEELTIYINSHKVGRFLTNVKQTMKSLNLCKCKIMVPEHIQSGEDWPGMTQFQLRFVAKPIAHQTLQLLPSLLDKVPNLEHLAFTDYDNTCYRSALLGEKCLQSISGLGRLRELHLYRNNLVTDEWMEVAARALPALRAVDVSGCRAVTAAGVLALCRARPALRKLGVAYLRLSEADVEACVRCCDQLEFLDASSNEEITLGMLGRIARPRPSPLVMRLYDYRISSGNAEVFEGLEVIWHWMERGWTRPRLTTSLNLDFDRSPATLYYFTDAQSTALKVASENQDDWLECV